MYVLATWFKQSEYKGIQYDTEKAVRSAGNAMPSTYCDVTKLIYLLSLDVSLIALLVTHYPLMGTFEMTFQLI